MELNYQDKPIQSVRQLIDDARRQVVRNLNTVMLHTYFGIGRMIVEEEQRGDNRAGYAEMIIKNLSVALTREYGRGYSPRNLDFSEILSHLPVANFAISDCEIFRSGANQGCSSAARAACGAISSKMSLTILNDSFFMSNALLLLKILVLLL